MKKTDLINTLSAQTNVSKAEVTDVLIALGGLAKEVIADGNEFIVPGIVTLTPKATAERKARNPRTGEEVVVPAGRTVKAKVAKGLKDAA